jgi:hypothetical protein
MLVNRKVDFNTVVVCIGKNIYTWEVGPGLGWVAAASGSVIGPEL